MKLFCIGRNYAAHAQELNNPLPDDPVIFMKPPTALLKGGKPFYYPDFSEEVHFECELVIRICRNGKHIQEKFARKYYDRYTLGIDFTARDLQRKLKEKGLPWETAKGFDSAAAIGSEWVELQQNDDIQQVTFSLNKNGTTVQQGDASLMLYKVNYLISYLSRYFTLQQGDLIYTGTPAGVGPVAVGDVLEGYVGTTKLLHCEVK